MTAKIREIQLPPRTRVAAKHTAISKDLLGRIKDGRLTGMLPGVRRLADEYGVTLMTANKAVNNLVAQGVLYRVANIGTFVADSAPVRTNVLAVVVNNVNLPLTSRLVNAMSQEAGKAGKRLLLYQHGGDEKREVLIVRELIGERLADGVFLYPSSDSVEHEALRLLHEAAVPTAVLAFGVMPPQWEAYHVLHGDHRTGFRKGTEHLLAAGHRQIGLVTPAGSVAPLFASEPAVRERWEGYAAAMRSAGLTPAAPITVDFAALRNGGLAQEMFDKIRTCTAVMVYCDTVAAALLTCLGRRGAHVPEDLSVLSYDGAPFTEDLHLSTMSQPMEEIGRVAVELLLDSDALKAPRHIAFTAALVERGSVRRLAALPE